MNHLFNLTVVIYFVFSIMESLNYFTLDNKFHVVIKCLPILSLISGVRQKFYSLQEFKQNNHAWRLFIALWFSVCADALLVYGDEVTFFLSGLSLFMVAILFYMQAFGWKKLKIEILPITFFSSTSCYYIAFELFSEVPLELKICCLVYILVGQTCIWRAWARVDWNDVKKGETKDLLAAIGVISFAASDFTLAIDKFSFPIQYSRYIVMPTYYFAQYAISSSVQRQAKSRSR